MKELNLFLKMHFTSLSPDGQCISLAIVSDWYEKLVPIGEKRKFATDAGTLISKQHKMDDEYMMMKDFIPSKSFYTEFTDFDINRCDDWVKENIISKLEFYPESHDKTDEYDMQHWYMCKNTEDIKIKLTKWLSQFSEYKLNFIVDCGWFDWYKFIELIGDWHINSSYKVTPTDFIIPKAVDFKVGLPKLPPNFPPVPQDLNELITYKKGISVSEAFKFDREEMIELFGNPKESIYRELYSITSEEFGEKRVSNKFNALWDAKVTKEIYTKLK
jgi:hypothetical protein